MSTVTTKDLHITKVEILKCGAGFRDFCFVKMSTDGIMPNDTKPIIGWSEFLEERNFGIVQVIEWMGGLIIGQNPMPYAKIISQLKANTRHIVNGIAQQAIAAIENALLDVVGKALNVPVCQLFGGPIRTELPVYWSHCGSFRVNFSKMLYNPITKQQPPPLNSLNSIKSLCEEVRNSGHTSLKTNIFLFDENENEPGQMYMPGFGGGNGSPGLNVPSKLIPKLVKQMKTFRECVGDDIGLKLDLNYNFKTSGFVEIAQALTPKALNGRGLDWLELDTYSPQALKYIRDNSPMPIASLESVMGRSNLLPFLQAESVDYCIIDPLWNGVDESIKMANLCDIYEVNCAAHNYHGWLGTAICAHFCASIPNFKILETDVDDVPWKDEIIKGDVPIIKNGIYYLDANKPGWGVDIDEEVLKKYPSTNNLRSGIWSEARNGMGIKKEHRLNLKLPSKL